MYETSGTNFSLNPKPIRAALIPHPKPIRAALIPDPEPIGPALIPDPKPVRPIFELLIAVSSTGPLGASEGMPYVAGWKLVQHSGCPEVKSTPRITETSVLRVFADEIAEPEFDYRIGHHVTEYRVELGRHHPNCCKGQAS